jgi:hypothetical protein
MRRFLIAIEGSNWNDFQDIELPEAPKTGDAIETRYGTCLVTSVELEPDGGDRAGKIVCAFPDHSLPGAPR